ncbi:ribosomal L7Ae/L30e/S12e/Gadd45 family protein [archaeon]|nr:ribosomal L7Ae/L30e/S12e/Gadd45 family protein [archaeon]
MSVKELTEAIKNENVSFGIKEVLKAVKVKKMKKTSRVFISKDARETTIEVLEKAGVEFEVLKSKQELTKLLGLDFESEVFFIQ